MLTFILLACGLIFVVLAIALAYSANQRKRAGQSGQAAVNNQQSNEGRPTVGRPSGLN